jgi:hypothetical protein
MNGIWGMEGGKPANSCFPGGVSGNPGGLRAYLLTSKSLPDGGMRDDFVKFFEEKTLESEAISMV